MLSNYLKKCLSGTYSRCLRKAYKGGFSPSECRTEDDSCADQNLSEIDGDSYMATLASTTPKRYMYF